MWKRPASKTKTPGKVKVSSGAGTSGMEGGNDRAGFLALSPALLDLQLGQPYGNCQPSTECKAHSRTSCSMGSYCLCDRCSVAIHDAVRACRWVFCSWIYCACSLAARRKSGCCTLRFLGASRHYWLRKCLVRATENIASTSKEVARLRYGFRITGLWLLYRRLGD